MSQERHEFTGAEVESLLAALDERLKRRGVSGSIFVVGGAAIAVTTIGGGRSTEDVDAITRDRVVLDEARLLAKEAGLPPDWLNSRANMWMPPLPSGALRPNLGPGLRITYADDEFLLATKLIAQRRKDAGDIVELAQRLALVEPEPAQLEAIIRRYYTDEGALEFILDDSSDIDGEIQYLSEAAARVIGRHSGP